MRHKLALALLLLSVPLLAGTSRRTERVTTDSTRLHIVHDDDRHYASFERDGVRYVTEDRGVLEEIDAALGPQRELSRAHSEFGRRHSELGREHARLGREHARLGREHARAARAGSPEDAEARQRELERMQAELERRQEELERRQADLEREQRELERRQERLEGEADRRIEEIFQRAVRAGKARREG